MIGYAKNDTCAMLILVIKVLWERDRKHCHVNRHPRNRPVVDDAAHLLTLGL